MEIIVYAYVVADLLHIGHVLALENAKALGDKLIVGVLTDEAVMEEKKSKPALSFNERLKLIQSLKCVDVAILQNTYSPINNIKNIKPNILMESNSHSNKDLKETSKIAKKLGIRIFKMPYYSKQSSTKIKQIIKKR